MTQKELNKIIRLHKKWLYDKKDGVKADLSYTDLSGLNLSRAGLRRAEMQAVHAASARLDGAGLRSADLRGARLEKVRYNERTSSFALCCPETGAFVGYKRCQDGRIVKLLIPEDAQRSSATSRKCRASKATVLEITDDRLPGQTYDCAVSRYDRYFEYHVGETVSVPNSNEDRWNECSPGIHFFPTRDEALNYR